MEELCTISDVYVLEEGHKNIVGVAKGLSAFRLFIVDEKCIEMQAGISEGFSDTQLFTVDEKMYRNTSGGTCI